MIITFIGSMLAGLGIGLLSGLLGVGGGVIMVPLFRLLFGMAPTVSTATSLFTIIPTSVTGAITHIRGKTCVPKLGLALGIGGASTSALGVWLAEQSPGWVVMLAAALVIGYSASTMLRKALKVPKSPTKTEKAEKVAAAEATGMDASTAVVAETAPTTTSADSAIDARDSAPMPDAAPAPAVAPAPDAAPAAAPAPASAPAAPAPAPPEIPSFSPRDLLKAAFIGMAAGVASGYVGLGGGFIMVPLMTSLLGMPMRVTSGTSLIAVMILATPATIMQCVLGNVNYLAGIAVACGSIPGAIVGARLARRVPERALRLTFAAFLGVAAILLVVRELGALA